MVVEKGYKETVVGIIPIDWDVVKIGDFIVFKNGLNKEKKFFGYGTPIINYMDVFNFRGLTSTDILGKVSLNKSEINTYLAKKGDVFFTRTSETVEEIGMSSVLLEDSLETVFSGFVLRGREYSNKLENEFKKYCFSEQSVRSQIISTASYTTRALTNGRLLSQVYVKVPPLPEQTAIANALSDMDALITQTEKLIEKKKAIKQGVMQELLKPKEGWVTKKLGEVGMCLRGVSYSPETDLDLDENENNLSLLRSNNIQNGLIDKNNLQFVKSHIVKEFQIIKDSDIIICMANGSKQLVGKAAITDNLKRNRYTYGAFMGCFRVNSNNNPNFIFALMESKQYRDYIDILLAGSSINNLNPGAIESMSFQIPERSIQDSVADLLGDIQKSIIKNQAKLQKLKHQKQGMMQALLTGKIRLI